MFEDDKENLQQDTADIESVEPTEQADTGDIEASETLDDAEPALTEDVTDKDDAAHTDDDTIIVTIGDEEPEVDDKEESAPAWVKEVRAKNKEMAKELRQLKAEKEARERAAQPQKLREKPTMQEFAYDEKAYEDALITWHEEKRALDKQAESAAKEQEAENANFQERVKLYETGRSQLKVKDFPDAEEEVFNALSDTRKNMLVITADDPALVTYALGKNPKDLARLAAIKNHALFIKEVVKLEQKLNVKQRKPATQPERAAKAAGGIASSEKHAEALLKQAGETGDFTKYNAYQRKLQQGK